MLFVCYGEFVCSPFFFLVVINTLYLFKPPDGRIQLCMNTQLALVIQHQRLVVLYIDARVYF